jgi:anti-sigma factor RsiW
MPDCPYKLRLQAYHDGQLRPDDAGEIERHLPDCGGCAGELAALRELSELLGDRQAAIIRADELSRIHAAVEEVSDRSLLRLAVAMASVAASILIISMAWMYDLPTATSPLVQQDHAVPEWERLAEMQRPDTPFADSSTEAGLADARDTADWMLKGIERHSQP